MNSESISMKQLNERLPKLGKDEIVLDVRSRDEYTQAHVPGSRNIPHDQVAAHADELKRYARVYIHCQLGRRAQMAVAALSQKGLTNLVCIADGGMADWLSAGYPVQKGD